MRTINRVSMTFVMLMGLGSFGCFEQEYLAQDLCRKFCECEQVLPNARAACETECTAQLEPFVNQVSNECLSCISYGQCTQGRLHCDRVCNIQNMGDPPDASSNQPDAFIFTLPDGGTDASSN